MERICIIGCPGSGKSTLASRLAAATNIPAIHLDQLFWKENGSAYRRRIR
ncbi:MAG: AAA family ATPase [Holdemania massiliensis]